MSSILQTEQDDHGIVTLTLNDPDTRNALTGNSMVDDLLAELERLQRDPSVRVLILTGAGKVFSSGGNIKEMGRQIEPDVKVETLRHAYQFGIQRLPLALQNIEIPTIAAVNGPAIGAGCDLACMCDIRIAADTAFFAESFVKMGLVAGDGGAWLLPRAVGMSRAAEMTFTGDAIDAQQALAWGLVSRVSPAAQLREDSLALARRIAVNPPEAVRMSKRLLREAQLGRLDTVLEMAAGFQAIAHKTPGHAQAVHDFLNRHANKKK